MPEIFRTAAKFEPCGHCGKKPTTLSFSVCGDCRAIAFCSKQCQRTAWPSHRDFCRASQTISALDDNGKPTKIAKQQRLAREFINLHNVTIQVAIQNAISHQLAMTMQTLQSSNLQLDVLDWTLRHTVHIRLSPRADSEDNGNPSTAFRIHSARFCAFDEFDDETRTRLSFTPRDVARFRAAVASQVTALPNGICGVLIWCIDVPRIPPMRFHYTLSQIGLISLLKNALPGAHQREDLAMDPCWLGELKERVEEGLIIRADLQAMDMKMGRMAKMGEKWMWLELSEEEARVYKADFVMYLPDGRFKTWDD